METIDLSLDPRKLLPVGKILGYLADDSDTFGLRVGQQIYSLTTSTLDIWWEARRVESEEALVRWAQQMKKTESASRAVTAMRSQGLLTGIDSLLDMNLHSNGWGIGASDEGTDFTIAELSFEPRCIVDKFSYNVWSLADGSVTGNDLIARAESGVASRKLLEGKMKASIAGLVKLSVLELQRRSA